MELRGSCFPRHKIYGAIDGGYTGRLLIQLQVTGGWDVSSYCDPKVNQPGEKEITNWSKTSDIQQAGNIPFADFANNATFFEKYHRDMLVINGVDMQTNSHDTGVIHNWSGRPAEGFPSLTAMFAASNAPDQPLSYLNFGGFSQTEKLIRFSRLGDIATLKNLIRPEDNVGETTLRNADDVALIRAAATARFGRQLSNPNLTPRQLENLSAYQQASVSRSNLTKISKYLPAPKDVIENKQVTPEFSSSLQRQIQLTVATFKPGVSSASDLYLDGFDTHNNHDSLHEPALNHLNESIEFLWTLAETANIADRLTVIIGSDFSRTPHYNEEKGKDHWPIGPLAPSSSWRSHLLGVTKSSAPLMKCKMLTESTQKLCNQTTRKARTYTQNMFTKPCGDT